jgi:hypothetical protein
MIRPAVRFLIAALTVSALPCPESWAQTPTPPATPAPTTTPVLDPAKVTTLEKQMADLQKQIDDIKKKPVEKKKLSLSDEGKRRKMARPAGRPRRRRE